jgi:hypothetical protein
MTRSPAVAVLIALLAPAVAAAQAAPRDPHAVQPERPTVATHAYAVAPGWVEIEAGVEADRYGGGARGWVAPVLVKIGLAPRLQLDLLGSFLGPPGSGTTGPGDLAIGVKWELLAGVPLLGDAAAVAQLKAPTAPTASGLGTGTTDMSLVFVSSHQLGPVEMDLNIGYTRRSGRGTAAPKSASLWTASFGGAAVGALGWVAEVYGYPGTAGPAGMAPIVAVLAGPTLELRPWLALDAGIIAPLRGPQPRALYTGLVWNVGRL